MPCAEILKLKSCVIHDMPMVLGVTCMKSTTLEKKKKNTRRREKSKEQNGIQDFVNEKMAISKSCKEACRPFS